MTETHLHQRIGGMTYFSDLLSAYSKRIGINSPQIANYCGLDRVTVYRFMKGKTLPKDRETVGRMAEILQLTGDERENLEEAYECARLSPRVYWERKYIQSFLRSFTGTNPVVPLVQYESEDVQDPRKDTLVVSGRDYTLKRIQKEILNECDSEHCDTKLIMRPGIDPVMDMLLSVGKKNRSLKIKHLIPLTTAFLSGPTLPISSRTGKVRAGNPGASGLQAGLGSPRQLLTPPGKERGGGISPLLAGDSVSGDGLLWNHELLQNFFKIVSMCSESFDYEPSYFYSRQSEIGTFPLYSNLLVTENSAVLFTDDLSESIFFRNPDQVAAFHRKYDRIAVGKPALSYVFRDIESFMVNMNNVILKRDRNKEDREYFYASQPCIIPILTEEMIKNHLRTDIFPHESEDRNSALKNIYNYIGAIQARYKNSDNNAVNYLSESGIRYFMKTGRFAEVPMELYTPLTVEERREMVLKLAESPNFSPRILKKELSPPEGMLCIEAMDKSLFLEFLAPDKGMCFLYVNEPGILLAFRNFFSGFSKDELYSEEESREILRRIAQE